MASVHVHPELPAEMRPPRWTNERAIFAGEPIVSSFAPGDRGERQLQSVTRFEERANRIAVIRSYVFCREVVREIGAATALTVEQIFYQLPAGMRR